MYDVAIIGAGLAGGLAAHLLARQGLQIAIIDLAAEHPEEFRAEQIVGEQVEILRALQLLDRIVGDRRCTGSARCYDSSGRLMGRVRAPHYGLPYAQMVNGLTPFPETVKQIIDRVIAIDHQDRGQCLSLQSGHHIKSRLTVLATGLHRSLHKGLGEVRETLSVHHSLTAGFNVQTDQPVDEVLVMHGNERNHIDYVTLFPYEGGTIRANLFVYGDTAQFVAPLQRADGLHRLLPNLCSAMGEIRITSKVLTRSNHLWVSRIAKPGIVAIGDAYQTPCPAAGTGIIRLLFDVQALAYYVPRWLRAGDVSVGRIQEFYEDGARAAADAKALHDARYRRAVRTEASLRWQIHRWRVRQQVRALILLRHRRHSDLITAAAADPCRTAPGGPAALASGLGCVARSIPIVDAERL
jgi:2-polyprenyl-6-methoxyphenol hydroxylase-like FAD-dependent oxidoreductase